MTTQSTPTSISVEAPHQISERTRARMQEAYRMIHAIAADIEDEKRRSAEEAASAVSEVSGPDTARAQKETATNPSTSTVTVS